MKRTLALLLFVLLAFAQEEQLSYLQEANLADFSTNSLITAFAAKQGEILRKVFTHYVRDQIHRWERSNIGPEVIRAKVLDLVVGRRDDLYRELKTFVEDRLFAKLEMHLLVGSLQKEIRQNPQNYYLTFEVYDLLID